MLLQRLQKGITRPWLIVWLVLLANPCGLFAQNAQLKVDLGAVVAPIQPTMYGIFFEDINFAADGGLYAEMVKNRSFEFTLPKMGWSEPGSTAYGFNPESGSSSVVRYKEAEGNQRYLQVRVENDAGYSLVNKGFRGMGVRKDAKYHLSFRAGNLEGSLSAAHFSLKDSTGTLLARATVALEPGGWKDYTAELTASETEALAELHITFGGTGKIDLDMISLFPVATWKGREKGLRKDLVELLDAMDPGFLRFPGGCIVEGRTLARRYQWKKTVGPVAEREALINRWNTEFSHRPAPDYYQSFGLGFFEYFQLAEDMGAEPLPILGCGMACQFNTGELVPLDDLEPYVQDALDLIQFANGTTDTPWGKVRAEMGHPDPFDMKYLGIGNEQWGPEYIERYKVFAAVLEARHPEIQLISTPGPFPSGDFFDYGWEELTRLGADILDEHYYQSPEWFRDNARRYDSYDRKGPKVFAGEYAAQSVGTTSPENENNWECALSEAAFMTGLERNADVVIMTSYAPLMAHADGWQWTPDLIWFNNLESYGTPNYYVQKLFATNPGTDLLRLTRDGESLTGQEGLYGSAVRDTDSGELILKLVNTAESPLEIDLELSGGRIQPMAEHVVLRSDDPNAVNSFETPQNIAPVKIRVNVNPKNPRMALTPLSVNILRFKLR